jgi:hypothetical protein
VNGAELLADSARIVSLRDRRAIVRLRQLAPAVHEV